MASRREVIAAVRSLRNDLMSRRREGSVRDRLHNQCDRISTLDLSGDDWASADMPDPLFTQERGHSIRIIPGEGLTGIVVSLTGKKILGTVTNREDDAAVMEELSHLTGSGSWRKKEHRYTRR